MKIFERNMNQAIQGDVMFTRVDKLPEGLTKLKPKDRRFVVAHSETGHHHAFAEDADVEVLEDPENELVAYLQVKSPSNLEHHRSFDTHETVQFIPGIYRVNRQREYIPKGYRRVSD